MKSDELIKLGMAASPGLLALTWQLYKHFSDRREKRREQERQRQAELTFVDIAVESKPQFGSGARVRISNQGMRETLIDAAYFTYGEEKFKRSKGEGDLKTFGQFTGIPLSCVDSFSEPLKPGHHRDYWLKLDASRLEQVANELNRANVWIEIKTTSGTSLRIEHSQIAWVIQRLIDDFKKAESKSTV